MGPHVVIRKAPGSPGNTAQCASIATRASEVEHPEGNGMVRSFVSSGQNCCDTMAPIEHHNTGQGGGG